MTFEELSKRLEEIVDKVEKSDITLEEGTKLFEEGVKIAKECHEMLDKSKGKIVTIKKDLDKIIEDEDIED